MQNQVTPLLHQRPPINHLTDAMLLKQFYSSSRDRAFQLMLKKYDAQQLVLRYMLLRGFSLHDAEDLCQEVLLTFFQNLQAQKFSLQQEGCLVRYLIGVARNYCLKAMRRRASEKYSIIPLDINTHTLKISDRTNRYIEEIPFQEQALMASFLQMDFRSQRLLWGYHVQGESYQALAQELGLANWRVACQQTYRKRKALRLATERQLTAGK